MASIMRFYALILSTVLLFSGVPGFFPDIPLFQAVVEIFALALVLSAIHAAMGLLGLLITALASDETVRIYVIGMALLYGILVAIAVAGINVSSVLYFNGADIWLHGLIFALSLGVILASTAGGRMRPRKAPAVAAVPASQPGIPTVPVQNPGAGALPFLSQMPSPDMTSVSSQTPQPNQPASSQVAQPPQQPWANPWVSGQSPLQPSQPGQPDQARNPWTREQRHMSVPQPVQHSISSPVGQQASVNPWAIYPDQWPQSQPPQSPPQPSAPSPNPWSFDPQPSQNPLSQGLQQRDQRPLDGWPPLHDSRPTH
ncbi:MAG TPA: hypothetical protein VFU63_15190 [Ktedonobacterales bacterium]|nr:hypothetical protein [Ktedonobacterales bacterium]